MCLGDNELRQDIETIPLHAFKQFIAPNNQIKGNLGNILIPETL